MASGAGSRDAFLRRRYAAAEQMDALRPRSPPERWQETVIAFDGYEDGVHGPLLYLIDSDTRHRGQGYVYPRALGIEPPPFYVRD